MVIETAALALVLQQASMTGVVRDSVDLEPVPLARIVISVRGTPVGETLSDRYGAFALVDIAPGAGQLEVSGLGYETWTLAYDQPPSDALRVLMRPAPLVLEGIEATVAARRGDPLAASAGSFVIDRTLVRAQPVVFETDVLRAASILPAASASSDWAAIPYIRGGSSEGTLVLLDGVRLFNPFHTFGFMSSFSGQAVRQVRLLTGSEEAGQAVGSLSGAFDVLTRDGARDRFRMNGSLGLVFARVAVEGPLGSSTSYLVDARQSHIQTISVGHVPLSFNDIHAKVTRDLGGVGRVSVTGFLSREGMNISFLPERAELHDTIRWQWNNAAVSMHYRDQLGGSTIMDAHAGFSRFRGHHKEVKGVTTQDDYEGSMHEVRTDLRVTHNIGRTKIVGGVQAVRFGADHASRAQREYFFVPFSGAGTQTRIAAYANVRVPLTGGVSARAGLRADRFLGLETTLAPLAGINYETPWWRAWVSGSRSYQALSSVRNEEAGTASFWALDVLLPVEQAPIPSSTDLVTGWEGSVGAWNVRMEAYARWMANLRLFPLHRDHFDAPQYGPPGSQQIATGEAQGIELSGSWIRAGRSSVVASYRWGRVKRNVQGVHYTPRFHRAHEVELSTALERGSSTWSLRFSGRSGQPMTPFLGILPFVGVKWPDSDLAVIDDNAVFLGGRYNTGTLPVYLRFDVGWRTSREVTWFGGGTIEPYVSIVNLFSLPNVVGQMPDYSKGKAELATSPQMPMFPFFGVEYRF